MPAKPEPKKEKGPSFEEAMARLEEVVGEMESDQLPLETLLARYEEGMKLVGLCTGKLADAERRIQIITKNEAGQPALAPFDETRADSPEEPSDEPDPSEPSLF